MQQSVKLFLLLVLYGPYCTKDQDKKITEPRMVEESITLLNEICPNGTNTLDTKRTDRLTDRITVSIADYPFVAALIITDTWNVVYYRTGAIVSDTHVLTAPVSVPGFDPPTSSIIVRAGSNFVDKEGFTFETRGFKNHDLLNVTNAANLVAIVTIKGSFSGYANVQPIALEMSVLPLTANVSCVSVGWGFDEINAKVVNLSRTEYKLAPDTACKSLYPVLDPSAQCVKPVLGNACAGDLGSPLICRNRLYGLAVAFNFRLGIQLSAKILAASIQAFLTP